MTADDDDSSLAIVLLAAAGTKLKEHFASFQVQE
jgi:hypothetical protein